MSALDMFWAAPPISRTLAASALTLSVLVYTGILPFYYVAWYMPGFLKMPPQLWRAITCFLMTGPKLGIVTNPQQCIHMGASLRQDLLNLHSQETSSPTLYSSLLPLYALFPTIAVPGDEEDYPYTSTGPSFAINPKGQFAVWAWWDGLNIFITGGMIFTSALVLAFTYTAMQDARGQKANFFVITIPAQWTPYAMLLMTFMMAGPDEAKIQGTGLIAAHLHDFLTRIWPTFGGGRNLVPTPGFVTRMFQKTQATVADRTYGTAFTPAQRASASASGAAAGGVLPETWRNRGIAFSALKREVAVSPTISLIDAGVGKRPALLLDLNEFSSILVAGLFLITFSTATPLKDIFGRATGIGTVFDHNFPDPSIVQGDDGKWYAFSTTSDSKNVPAAQADCIACAWTLLSNDLLPTTPSWSSGGNVWAPDVRKVNGQWVLYFAAPAKDSSKHCVGVATASTILGPYTAVPTALACPLEIGGAIDPSGFLDDDDTKYVVYKVDGNSVGNGGSCGNTVDPIQSTPIMLQKMQANGVDPDGDPIQVLDRGDADGPLIEAPNLIKHNGIYFLFFSSNCYSTSLYDISYATTTDVLGPYTKAAKPLAVTNNPFQLTAPGGATATEDGTTLAFHGNCDAGRCFYLGTLGYNENVLSISVIAH
ncbi:hypothetical protein B7494_g5395 [Chlorociboria aeruginascens]|nr:hypothetical protein B7494_g5395 [Chlorociboria aeruginascens]